MSISLTSVRYFLEAAKLENFSLAANRLYTAQPNLSKRISALESELGVTLFHRSGKRVRLTEAGQLVYREFSEALERMDKAVQQARSLEQDKQDTIVIGILEGQRIGPDGPHLLEEFYRRYPNVYLKFERAGLYRLRQELMSGGFDMIVAVESAGANYLDAHKRVLKTFSGVIAINAQNPMANRETLTLPMLSQENFVTLSQNEASQGYDALAAACRPYGFAPRIIREADSVETLLLYVEMGMGVALLSGNTRLAANPDVRLVPLRDVTFQLAAYWHDSAGPFVETMLQMLEGADVMRRSKDI